MNETTHPARRLRHGERPTEPLVFEDDAANKAAEEGGLPALPEPMFKSVVNGGMLVRDGYDSLQVFEYARAAIAADRASRQVANKAEVEPVLPSIETLRFHALLCKVEQACSDADTDVRLSPAHVEARNKLITHIDQHVATQARAARATPPATTGASTVIELDAYDAGLLSDFGGGEVNWWQDYIRAELDRAHEFYQSQVEGSVGASTVLTDERIEQIWDVTETADAETLKEVRLRFARAIAREVAAQAGQVAVPEGFALVPCASSVDMDQAGHDSLLASGLNAEQGDAERCWNSMLAAAPSPAKESK